MLIVGAGGFAKELLENVLNDKAFGEIVFYDGINFNEGIDNFVYNKYPILINDKQVESYFKNSDRRFVLGVGNPKIRYDLYLKFKKIGGTLTSTISQNSSIAANDVKIGFGSNIMDYAVISNGVRIGLGCLIYFNSNITHDSQIGNFVQISPGVQILGNVKIGEMTLIGANATILPNTIIGKNVIVGAGSVVTKDIPDNSIVFGNPAKSKIA